MSRHRELGLTDAEYELIVDKLGREPNEVELAVFSLMWSEHCGYKHSRRLLKTLPTEGPRLVLGPGENAGAVDIGGGMAAAFKVESHNHPSAVEPFQGAATGVGGILRDVFAIGARPIAILDSLRFGEPSSPRSRYLLEHAVAGIGHYGNSIGVATVGGEIYFEGPYEQNCLVNAMCVGLIETSKLIRSAAAGVGNVVVLFGARTGRDGIGGASVLASAELGDEDASKRPTVQIGDPFEESKLLECSLELLDRSLLVALQDLGAAGLTSSSSEMAAKGGVGIDLDVRARAAARGRHGAVRDHDLRVAGADAVRGRAGAARRRAGRVREVGGQRDRDRRGDRRRPAAGVRRRGAGRRPAGERAGRRVPGVRPRAARAERRRSTRRPSGCSTTISRAGDTLLALLGSANLASRRWAFEQYDCVVGSRTVRRPEQADAAVLMLEHGGAIAVSIDGNGRRVAVDPYRGAVEAVLECSANLACVGAEPLGLTNCLNFGNPEKPHIAWQLTRAVAGLGDACRALGRAGRGRQRVALQRGRRRSDLPDAGRRHGRRAARPGALRPARVLGRGRRGRADQRVVGAERGRLRARQAARRARSRARSRPPTSARCGRCTPRSARPSARARCGRRTTSPRAASRSRWRSAASPAGSARAWRSTAPLFAEGPGAFVVSGPPEAMTAFGAAARVIGEVGGDALAIGGELDIPVVELARVHGDGLAALVA